MRLGTAIVLLALGAILTFAIEFEISGVDLRVVGWILMIVGLISFLLTLLFWSTWWGPGYFRRRTSYGAAAPPVADPYYGRSRTTYVEEEVDAPPGPGPGAPPPPPPPP